MIPGANLLNFAFALIATETVQYYRETGRNRQPNGVFVSTYAAAQQIDDCSVQAVNKRNYQAIGLDFAKNYVTLYIPSLAFTVIARGKSGDVFEWNGRRYQLVGGVDWMGEDGWGSAVACDIGPATGATTNG